MLKRLGIYLKEMFPLSSFLGTMITAITIQLVYLRLYDIRVEFSRQLIIPGLVLTFVSLLIRIMDEFKDYQDDLTNFPLRPLPSGRVKREDLKALGLFCVIAIVFLSVTSKPLLLWSLATLIFTGLMLKWFFVEKLMRKSLPLAFLSHHPIVVFNFIYLILACMQMDPRVGWDKILSILPICLIFTNWEILRKIRTPEQETTYTTYSKIWGPRKSIGLALVIQLIFSASVLCICESLKISPLWMAGFIILQLGVSFPSWRFLFTLKLSAPLKQQAELQIISVILFLLVIALI